MPEFPGGEEALLRFIKNHLEYPAREREEGISGTAIVSFVVDENGQVVNVEAVRFNYKRLQEVLLNRSSGAITEIQTRQTIR
jgi:hypothetical protein